jgi:small-conductance mechanosensitive channel
VLSILAATAILLPQLLLTVASAPHLAGTIRVGVGAVIVISLLTAVLIASRQGSRSGKGRRGRPRFPKAFVATFVIVATAVLARRRQPHRRAFGRHRDRRSLARRIETNRLFLLARATGKDEEPVAETLPDMLPLIVLAVFRFAILLMGIAGLILIMRVPLAELTTGSNPLAQFALRVADTVALAFVVYVGWIAIRFAIDRRLRQLAPLDPHSPPTENTRLLTLLPLLRTTLAIVFVTVFTLSALWTLGIQIAPLLAGAGIFGLAIGFGAQTLVRDVILGVFFLIEDVFRIWRIHRKRDDHQRHRGTYLVQNRGTAPPQRSVDLRALRSAWHHAQRLPRLGNQQVQSAATTFGRQRKNPQDDQGHRRGHDARSGARPVDPGAAEGQALPCGPGCQNIPLQFYDGPRLSVRRRHGGAQKDRGRSRRAGDPFCGRVPADHLGQKSSSPGP